MYSDIEIAQAHKLRHITEIAHKLNIGEDMLEPYGHYKAKVNPKLINKNASGKLILVTAINPTPAGEGKTTVSIGLADGLDRLGKKTALALREPSLGPVFGVKGGAAGGGYAQVVPMESINLHFNGDIHAITAANNLLAAMVDNHIFQGNKLGIDPRTVTWKRCMDMNDRELRSIVAGLGGKVNGMPRQDGFDITAASEVMAILCMADGLEDLKRRLGNIVVGYTYDECPVLASQINAQGAMTALLVEAMMPNLVQTLGGVPAFIHGGPFANIAHGCNSVTATRMALSLADYAVTEAGFGADLGAEKFLDIKCRVNHLNPSAVVLVATIRALKYHGGVCKNETGLENLEALAAGLPNLGKHIENITGVYNLPVVVAINRFVSDTPAELEMVQAYCADKGIRAVIAEVWAKGGEGALELAQAVVELAEAPSTLRFSYDVNASIIDKLDCVVRRIYGGDGIDLSTEACKAIAAIEKNGYGNLPICIAKTQYSLSDDPKKLSCPTGFRVQVRNARVSAGAGFVVVLTGEVMTMPGLPRIPAAEQIDVDADGNITGLF